MIIRTMYETADGKIFDDKKNADEHEEELLRKAENAKIIECVKSIKEYCKSGWGCANCILANLCTKKFFCLLTGKFKKRRIDIMIEKNINYDANENFYSIGERPQNEIDKSNKIYEAMRILKEYCESTSNCRNCIIRRYCEEIPQEWGNLSKGV